MPDMLTPIHSPCSAPVTPIRTLFLSAQSGHGCTTTPAGDAYGRPTQKETATNKVNYWTLAFSTNDLAFWQVIMPRSYSGGPVIARVHWTAASGSGTVIWDIAGLMRGDDDALDTAYGTAQSVTDTLIATGDEHISDATPAITFAGTPAGGKLLLLRVTRSGGTLGADVPELIGVGIEFPTSGHSD